MKILKILMLSMLSIIPVHTSFSDVQVVIPSEYNALLRNKLMVSYIFTRKVVKWETGEKITVFTKPLDSIEHRYFLNQWLNMTSGKYRRELEGQTYSGRATGVKEVSTDEEMMVMVMNTPASIGYLNYGVILHDKSVKIINTDILY
jgi:ABC-type phosphate transport system substrate-binding protein